MEEWLKKWYKDRFEEIDASPSPKTWDNISEAIDEWPKQWYYNGFEKIDVPPSPKTWNNISEAMEEWPKHWYNSNINEIKTEPRADTWMGLESQLAQMYYGGRNRLVVAFTIIALILISIIPFNISDQFVGGANDHLAYQVSNQNKPSLVLDEFIATSDSYEETKSQSIENAQNNNLSSVERAGFYSDDAVSELSAKKDLLKSEGEDTGFENVNILTENEQSEINDSEHFDGKSLLVREIDFPKQDEHDLSLIDILPKVSYKNRSYAGIGVTPQFSSLRNPLNKNMKNSSDKEIQNPLSIGFDLSYEKFVTDKNSLGFSLRGNNVKQLKYITSGDTENEILKQFHLNYISLEVNYSKIWAVDKKDHIYLKTYAGVYWGYLVNKSVTYNTDRIDYIENGFRNFDFGTSLGILVSTKISSKMRFELGAIGQFGMINIFKGTEVLPSDYFRTATQSYGLTFGLSRRL